MNLTDRLFQNKFRRVTLLLVSGIIATACSSSAEPADNVSGRQILPSMEAAFAAGATVVEIDIAPPIRFGPSTERALLSRSTFHGPKPKVSPRQVPKRVSKNTTRRPAAARLSLHVKIL